MSSKTYRTTAEVYHHQDGKPPVFIAPKGVDIDYDLAVRLGLVDPAEAKARKVTDVENKAVKPAAAGTKRTKE
jgi:hypothetical protein